MALARKVTDPAKRLEQLIAYHDRQFQAVFLQAIELIKDRYTLKELVRLIEDNEFENALGVIESAGQLLGNAYGNALSAAAVSTATFLSDKALVGRISFDQTNVRAVAAMQENKLRLVQGFSADQRTLVRQVMADAINEGLNPREQARRFRDSIGLTAKQEQAVRRYRTALEAASTSSQEAANALNRKLRDRRFDRSVQRAQRNGQPLTTEQVDKMVDRYRSRYIKYRAETIGRTEAMRAVHQGTEEMYRQAIDEGELDPDELVRQWVSAHDGRVRDSHQHLNGEKRAIGETWNGLRYPGDPTAPAAETVNCRCSIATRMEPK